jgi:hypothetical protein
LSPPRETSARLLELEQILAHSRNALATDRDADSVALHLADVPSERMRRFTSLLRTGASGDNDAIDAVTMRLLLNDYTAAVGHLRAIARVAAAGIDAAAIPVRESQRFIRLEERREQKQEPRDTQTAGGPEGP